MPKKKGNGSGSYWKDGPVWKAEIMVGFKYVNGVKKKDVRRATRATAAEARAFLADAKANKSAPVKVAKMTMGELADAWYAQRIERVKGEKLEESSYTTDEYTAAHIREAWRDIPAIEMTAEEIERGIDAMKKWRSARQADGTYKRTVTNEPLGISGKRKVKCMLGQIFRYAERRGVIPRNSSPAPLVERLVNTERDKRGKDAYSLLDIAALLRYITPESDNKYGHALIVDMIAGFRRQEMVPLLADDIDMMPAIEYEIRDGDRVITMDNIDAVDLTADVTIREIPQCRIRISKAVKLKKHSETYIGKTKSRAGDRWAYLPELAWPHAQWLKDHADKRTGLVFYSEMSRTHIHPTTYSDNIEKMLKSLPVNKKLTAHELRHTAAKLWRRTAGVAEEIVMAQGGWSDKATMEHYADHTHANELRNAASVVNSILMASLNVQEKQE